MRSLPILAISLALIGCGADDVEPVTLNGTLQARGAVLPPASGEVVLAAIDLDRTDRVGDVLESTPFTGLAVGSDADWRLKLSAEIDDRWFYTPDGNAWGDVEIASFMLGAYNDANDSGAIEFSDVFVGAADIAVVYARGGKKVVPTGWYWFEYDADTWETGPDALKVFKNNLLSAPFETNLLPAERDGLSLHLVPAAVGPMNVDVWSLSGASDPVLLRETLTDTQPGLDFSVAQSFYEPPGDHTSSTLAHASGTDMAELCLYVVAAYTDIDGDGRWDPYNDSLIGHSSMAGDDSRLVQYARPLDLASAWTMTEHGVATGWNIVDNTPDAAGDLALYNWEDGIILDVQP